MADEPPVALVALLAKLHLATPDQVRGVRGGARKMARDLPLFDSVWIDALVQTRLLTPFQAREIIAGRGEQLLVGPYLLRRRIQRVGFAECFLATAIQHEETAKTKKRPIVHLVVARGLDRTQARRANAELQTLAERFKTLKSKGVTVLRGAGFCDSELWAAYDWPSGFSIHERLACQGRCSPAAALEIARQMVAALAALEKEQIVHGEITASSLWLTDAGEVQLSRCGVLSAVGVDENAAPVGIAAELLVSMAPERWLEPSSSYADRICCDIYACGCLWWHLLAGRPVLAGGNHETKLEAARTGKIPDIRRIAPDVSKILAAAIEFCTHRDPARRPQSFAELEKLLGAPSGAGRRLLALELFRGSRRTSRGDFKRRIQLSVQGAGQPLLSAIACALLLAAATWPLWRPKHAADEPRSAIPAAVAKGGGRLPNAQNGLAIFQRTKDASHSQLVGQERSDHDLRLASYQTRIDPADADENRSPSPVNRPIIELSGDREIAGGKLRLQAGAIVRGKHGERPCIAMPANGQVITADHVRFENIDFIWRQRPEEITSPDRHALLELRTNQTEFEGCTFQAQVVGSFELPAAIRLANNSQRGSALAPAVRVELDRCVIAGVACGVDCTARGPAAITARNTLYTGHGALVRFPQTRRADAPTSVALEHVTLRGAKAAIELDCDDAADSSGTVNVNTTACVFAPEEAGALAVFSGSQAPKITGGVLAALDWNCQESLISPAAAVAIWQHDQKQETLPDNELALEGLVSSPFDFLGRALSDPAASRLRTWLAPMRTEMTPGIGDDLPPLREIGETASPRDKP